MSYGGGAKCPKCGKTVYMAEEVVAEGKKWHKMCFKCNDCGKMLDTTTVKPHDGELYCGACYKRSYGPKGYGYGGGAGTLASEDGSAQQTGWKPVGGGNGNTTAFGGADKCPRCGKSVYAAEKIIGAGSSWHKGCFNCAECNKKLDSTTVSDKDGQIYCKGCYGKNFGPKGVGFGQGAGALTRT